MRALPPPHRAPIDTEALGHNMHGDVTLEQIDCAQPPSLEFGRAPLWAHAHLLQKEYRTLFTQKSLVDSRGRACECDRPAYRPVCWCRLRAGPPARTRGCPD